MEVEHSMTDQANFGKPLLTDRTNGRLLPAPRADRPQRREMFYPVQCANPQCGNVRWLTKGDADRAETERRVCKKCQTAEAGKRGYAATVARHGTDFALNAVRQ